MFPRPRAIPPALPKRAVRDRTAFAICIGLGVGLSSCGRAAIADFRAPAVLRSMDMEARVGQLIMLSLPGDGVLPRAAIKILEECRPGAVLLFGYNARGGPEALREYTAGIQDACHGEPLPVWVAIDHEGGQVQRLVSDGFTRLPSPAEAGRIMDARGIERMAGLSARELRAVGVRLNLAPLAEAVFDGNRAFLGTRAFSDQTNLAAHLAAAFARGMEGSGVGAVYKHFPGNSSADPHLGLPVIQGEAREIDRQLILPFRRALMAYRPCAVMLSHAMVPALDPDRPASLSPAVVKLLREDLRFRGLILTDDLEMGAIRGARSAEESALMALMAGVDMLMFSAPATALRVKQAILAALASGRLDPVRVDEACLRILRAKLAIGIQGEADPRIRAEEFAAFSKAAAKTAKFIRLARGRADTEEGKAAK